MADDKKTRTPALPKSKNFYKDGSGPQLHSRYGMPENKQMKLLCTAPGEEFTFESDAVGGFKWTGPDGSTFEATVSGGVTYAKGGTTLTIDNNGDIKLAGHNRILVGGGAHIECTGDAGICVGGDTALVGMGKINARAKSVYVGSDGDINMNASGNMDIRAGNIAMHAGTIKMNSGGGAST